jgi:hypothetical protein
MEVPFGISGAFYPGSDKELNSAYLEILLNALVELDREYLRSVAKQGHRIPHLYESGIRYGRTLSWDTIPDLYAKGFGDCKSLTAAFCAQALEAGAQCRPSFRFRYRTRADKDKWLAEVMNLRNRFGPDDKMVVRKIKENDGGLDYHILVETYGGMTLKGRKLDYWHDPSKVLGMGVNENE